MFESLKKDFAAPNPDLVKCGKNLSALKVGILTNIRQLWLSILYTPIVESTDQS